MKEYKIVLTGTMGAGKTTAIAAISEVPPVSTEVRNQDEAVAKATTTVGLDYGEITLENGDKLRLYGTPGQPRFAFMWEILAKGALGLIVLIDNSRPDPLEDLSMYLRGFAGLIRETACVVAVGRTEVHGSPDLAAFSERALAHDVMCPVIPADVREPAQVLVLIDLLLAQLEGAEASTHR